MELFISHLRELLLQHFEGNLHPLEFTAAISHLYEYYCDLWVFIIFEPVEHGYFHPSLWWLCYSSVPLGFLISQTYLTFLHQALQSCLFLLFISASIVCLHVKIRDSISGKGPRRHYSITHKILCFSTSVLPYGISSQPIIPTKWCHMFMLKYRGPEERDVWFVTIVITLADVPCVDVNKCVSMCVHTSTFEHQHENKTKLWDEPSAYFSWEDQFMIYLLFNIIT